MVSEVRRRLPGGALQRTDRAIQPHALQRLDHQAPLPFGVGRGVQVLHAAPAASGSPDIAVQAAGRLDAKRGRGHQPGRGLQDDGFAGQGEMHEALPALGLVDTVAAAPEGGYRHRSLCHAGRRSMDLTASALRRMRRPSGKAASIAPETA